MAKIVFMGTPHFALPALEALLAHGHQVSLVLCQPDKKQGRGHKLQAPPVKELALKHQIPVYQPEKVRNNPECLEILKAEQADFFIVIAYGKILPQEILDLPKKACINVHASLLPHLRGAAPIQFSLILGDAVGGVTTMRMDVGMDTGDVLMMRQTPIGPEENSQELSERLSLSGAELLLETLAQFDSLTPQPQDHSKATYTRMLLKEDRLLDWRKSASEAFNHYRGLSPAPGVVGMLGDKRISFKRLRLGQRSGTLGQPGQILGFTQEGVEVACGQGSLLLVELQPENKSAMSALDWKNGFQITTSHRFSCP